jgi:hypothetical protein
MDGRCAAVERAAVKRRIRHLQIGRRLHEPSANRVTEAWRLSLDLTVDGVREGRDRFR